MPPMKRVTITLSSEATLAILAYMKEVKRLSPERAIEVALKLFFEKQ